MPQWTILSIAHVTEYALTAADLRGFVGVERPAYDLPSTMFGEFELAADGLGQANWETFH